MIESGFVFWYRDGPEPEWASEEEIEARRNAEWGPPEPRESSEDDE